MASEYFVEVFTQSLSTGLTSTTMAGYDGNLMKVLGSVSLLSLRGILPDELDGLLHGGSGAEYLRDP